MKIIGIDPGYNTGWAIYHDGKLVSLRTIQPSEMAAALALEQPSRVIFEDSRLTSFMFTTVKSRPVALNMARKVGQVDAWCRLITDICAELNIPAHGISPKAKGKKLDAKEFARITGWAGPSNEHTRDAAMVAWSYRGAR